MRLDRGFADEQGAADFPVGHATGGMREDLGFPRGQRRGSGFLWPAQVGDQAARDRRGEARCLHRKTERIPWASQVSGKSDPMSRSGAGMLLSGTM